MSEKMNWIIERYEGFEHGEPRGYETERFVFRKTATIEEMKELLHTYILLEKEWCGDKYFFSKDMFRVKEDSWQKPQEVLNNCFFVGFKMSDTENGPTTHHVSVLARPYENLRNFPSFDAASLQWE